MAPVIAYSKPDNFSRAAVMYLPNQELYNNYKAHDFEQQLRWFRRGWQEMLKYQLTQMEDRCHHCHRSHDVD